MASGSKSGPSDSSFGESSAPPESSLVANTQRRRPSKPRPSTSWFLPQAGAYAVRYAVGCKPREAVLYPDTVAGANPKVGPYCSSRSLLEGLWLMQRSESGDSRGSATGSSSRAAADGGPPRSRHQFRCVRWYRTVARGSTGVHNCVYVHHTYVNVYRRVTRVGREGVFCTCME